MVWISKLGIHNCRVLTDVETNLDEQANIIYGDNASGKSSVLEAITILAKGRSFRTPRIQEVITYQKDSLVVNAQLEAGQLTNTYPVGISKNSQKTCIRINHQDVKQQAELSIHLPITLIHPESVELLTGSPNNRRAFLDWIAFYRFPDFHSLWRQYQRVLKQRNSCLKETGQRQTLNHWTELLIKLQPDLYFYRLQALQALNSALASTYSLLEPVGIPQLKLSTGYPGEIAPNQIELLQAFHTKKLAYELQHGISLYGAHRADLSILLNNIPVQRIASRGQLKLLTIGLLLAQSYAISEYSSKRGIIAIDDLASELDLANQHVLYKALRATTQQLIITSTRPEYLQGWLTNARMFHLKQGLITSM